jgi:serine/threonine-protein kinase
MRRTIALVTLVGLFAALGVLLLGVEAVLPERVATHFGIDGLPNGWTSRDEFTKSTALIVILPVAVVQGIGLLLGRIPSSLINLPNRDYWLAPERRSETLERVRTAMLEFGNAMFAFLLFVVWSVIQANTTGSGRLGRVFEVSLFAFLAFVGTWSFFLLRPYLKVPGGN